MTKRWSISIALILAACGEPGPAPLADAGALPDAPPPATCDAPGATVGAACTIAAECSDGCFCNGEEACVEGRCEAGTAPCVDAHECTDDVCVEAARSCVFGPDAERCQDDDACNGREVCSADLGCLPAPALLDCSDGDPCTVDTCDPATGCGSTTVLRDADADGAVDARCGGDDCNDALDSIGPAREEICDNFIDDDCDGLRDYAQASCVATNDTCATARALPGSGSYSGTTAGLAADGTSSCSELGTDAFYAFRIDAPRRVRVAVWTPVDATVSLRLRTDCADPDPARDVRCANNGGAGAIVVDEPALAAGEYVIRVATGVPVAFGVELSITAPGTPVRGDRCDAELVDITASTVIAGDFALYDDDLTTTCGEAGALPEVVHRLHLDRPMDVVLEASLGMTPIVYRGVTLEVRRTCDDASTSLGCAMPDAQQDPLFEDQGVSRLRYAPLAAGDYFVVIERRQSYPTYELRATITEPVPRLEGDACGTAVDITNRTATLEPRRLVGSGSHGTRFEPDYLSNCGGVGTLFYPDAVFRFEVETTSDVMLDVDWIGDNAHLFVQADCGSVASELLCLETPRAYGPPLLRSVPPGDYFVIARAGGYHQPIHARATLLPPTPRPENDRCQDALEIGDGASRMDTLYGFADDVEACWAGRDALYRLTLDRESAVTALVESLDPFNPVTMGLLESDCATAITDCVPRALDRVLPPGTYFLAVQGYQETDFRLDVFVDPI
ncbi:putative metal-binding motif-containing protein [Sandaracinus amylolyticus]|uniref:Uncharacterized protein n=1 Tax=Sandaracinus amylolyticus TaxID=927083 RepID=A0A0F6YHP8_9BACT|nr:putative metal-binding motif-containing protein [Sandaracinus amylolyticus]AKF04947.1 hypothetical protein DB32_002096 [Sandaracinus amylolyticus]